MIKHSFRLLSVLTLLIIAGIKLPAQKITVTIGCHVNMDLDHDYFPISYLKTLADLDGNIYIMGGGTDSKRKDQFARNMVERISHDTTTNRTAYISFTLPDEKNPVPAYTFAMLNDKLYAFAETTGLKERTLYGSEVDKMTLQLKGNTTKIFSFSLSAQAHMQFPGDYPAIQSSKNETKLLVSILEKKENSNLGRLRMKVFEDDFQPAWEKTFTPPGPASGTYYIGIDKILDNGNVYVVGNNTYPDESHGAKKGSVRETRYVTLLSDHGETSLDRKIEFDNFSLTSSFIDFTENGKMIVAGTGMMKNGENVKPAIGYLLFEPGETKPAFEKINEIDRFPEGLGMVDWAVGTPIQNMFIRKDGSVILIAEHKKVNISNECLELNVYCLNPEGKLIWTTRIFKYQSDAFAPETICSYKAFDNGNSIIIFYNDNAANPLTDNKENPEKFTVMQEGMLVACTINDKGEISKQKLFGFDRKIEGIPCVPGMIRSGASEFAFLVGFSKKEKSRISYAEIN